MLVDADAILGNTNQNRFLILDLRHLDEPEPANVLCEISTHVCSTPFVDDVIVLDKSATADSRMRVFGADGREADFCCNGALLALAQIAEHASNQPLLLETTFGIRSGFTDCQTSVLHFGVVNSGDFRLDPSFDPYLKSFDACALGCCVAGEPHLILEMTYSSSIHVKTRRDFETFCSPLRDACDIEGGVNVTVIFACHNDYIVIRTYERGASRMTASCGSGALAAMSLISPKTLLRKNKRVYSTGGFHDVAYDEAIGGWSISGQVNIIGHAPLGELLDSDLIHGSTEHSFTPSDTPEASLLPLLNEKESISDHHIVSSRSTFHSIDKLGSTK